MTSRRTLPFALPAALLALLCAGLLPACSSTPPIVVGSDLDNAPFAYVDTNGNAAGRDVEMMVAIAHMLDRELTWKRIEFDELLPAAEAGRVDVVCATLGVTPERSRLVDFSRPYFVTELVVLVREAPDAPQTLNDLKYRKVAAGAGTTSQRAIEQLLPDSKGVFAAEGEGADANGNANATAGASTDAASPVELLLAGQVDAVVMDGPAADAALAAQPGQLRRLPGLFTPEHYALALPKNQSALRTQIDECLRKLQLGGSLERWNGKYGLKEVSTASQPD